jgi:ATP phosphoribosyltransferase regulatory subunit HisZ
MRTLPPLEEKIRRAIRDAKARNALITVVGLQQELEQKLHRTFDRKYLKKLCEKVHRKALIQADRNSTSILRALAS